MHRHLKSIATWWEGVFSKDSRVFPPQNPPKAKLEFSTSMLTLTLPITPFKSTCTCWQSPDLHMVLVLIPDLYPESDLLLGPTTWCDWWLKHLMDIVLDPKNPLNEKIMFGIGMLCFLSCNMAHVTQSAQILEDMCPPKFNNCSVSQNWGQCYTIFCHHQNLQCMLLHCLHLQKSNLSLSLSWDHYKIRCCWSNPGQNCYGQLGGNFQVGNTAPCSGPSFLIQRQSKQQFILSHKVALRQ